MTLVKLPLVHDLGEPLADIAAQEDVAEPMQDTPTMPDEPIPFDPTIFEKLLQRECRMWQQKLRLQDWNVRLRLCRLSDMPGRDCLGFIQPILERKDAHMCILSPMDVPLLPQEYINDEDMNYGLTIVHELLHLHTYAFTQNLTPHESAAEEQAINAISRVIVNAYSSKIRKLTPEGPHGPMSPGHYL